MIPTSPKLLYQTAPKVRVSKWKCLFAEITDASLVFGFTENGLVCARQKNVLILQFIDTLKSVANPLRSCFSDSVFKYSLACLGQTVMCPCKFSFYWKLSYAYLGSRVFKLSCSRAFLRLHILVIPHSNLDANEDDTFIGNRGGGFIRVVIRVVLSFIWISRLGKTLKERWVFLFSWFTTFHFAYKVTCPKSCSCFFPCYRLARI